MLWEKRNPFGPRQEDRRAGALAELIYGANRGKGSPVLRDHDFFPSLKPPESRRKQTPADHAETLKGWCQAWAAALRQKG